MKIYETFQTNVNVSIELQCYGNMNDIGFICKMKHIKLIWHKSILGSVDYNNMQRFSFTDRKSERAIIKQRD